MVAGDPQGPAAAAMLLSSCDVVIVQHEYGIYGGHDGDEVLSAAHRNSGCPPSSSCTPC